MVKIGVHLRKLS